VNASVETPTKGSRQVLLSVITKKLDRTFMIRKHVGEPFALAMQTCLGALTKWAAKKNLSKKHLHILIEDGDEDSGQLIEQAILTLCRSLMPWASWRQMWQRGSSEQPSTMQPTARSRMRKLLCELLNLSLRANMSETLLDR